MAENMEYRDMTLEERQEFGELSNQWGNPTDRRFPDKQSRRAIRPVEYGWYNMSAEQRGTALMSSWVIINNAIDTKDFSEVDDETFVVLGWGINDKDAIKVAKQLFPYPEVMFGEGENAAGWLRINSDDDSWFGFGTDGYGTQMISRIKDAANVDRPWLNKTFYDPGEMQLFQDALDGGNATEKEQRGQIAAEKGLRFGAAMLMAGMAWPSVAAKLSSQAGRLMNFTGMSVKGATPMSGSTAFWQSVQKGTQAWRASNVGKAVYAGRSAWFGMTAGSYLASLGLGLIDNPEDVYASIVAAEEAGELSPEAAELYTALTASIEGIDLPKGISAAHFWSGQVSLDAPVESWMRKVRTDFYAPPEDGDESPKYEAGQWGQGAADSVLTASAETSVPAIEEPGFRLSGDAPEVIARAEAEKEYQSRGPAAREAELQREANRIARRGPTIGEMAPDARFRSTVTSRGVLHPAYADMEQDEGARYAYETHVPRYFEQNYEDIMGDWSIDKTEWFQRQAVIAGLIDIEDNYVQWGSRDQQTRDAFRTVLEEANNNGNVWEDQLGEMGRQYQEWKAANPDEEEHYPAFVTPAYRKPDYATLAQEIKGSLRQKLQRQPSQAELQLLTDHLGSLDRQQWSGQVAAERAEHAARAREWESGLDGATPQEQSAGTVQQVDALARFDEFFEKKYKGEIEHRERVDRVQEKTPGLMASLSRIAGSM